MIKLLERSPDLTYSQLLAARSLGDVLFYDHKSIYDRLDDTTFEDWADGKVSDTYDIPSARPSDYNILRIIAEMVSFTHFFMMSQPQLWREVTTTDHATAVIDPWVERLRSLGVEIKLNTPCEGLRILKTEDRENDDNDYDGVVLATSIPGVKSILAKAKLMRAVMRALDAMK